MEPGGWQWKIDSGTHNHELVHLSAYSSVRRLGNTSRQQIASLHNASVPPRTILSMLQPSVQSFCAPAKAVDNITQALLREDLAGRTPLEALLDKLLLSSHPELHCVRRNEKKTIDCSFGYP